MGSSVFEEGDTVEVPGGACAEVLCWYSNGCFTSAGLYREEELSPGTGRVVWQSAAALWLPVEWPSMLWEDDSGTVQKIKEVRFSKSQDSEDPEEPLFVMEDGHVSWFVVEIELSSGRRV